MIEAEDLTRYYGNFAALQDATFRIEDREIVGFLGLNGAGKSTLLKILAGLLMPSAGKVTVSGIDATTDPDALRRRIGFLPEEPPLYREMRVEEFLHWVGQVKGRSRAQVQKDLPEVMETCQLTDVAHKVISELSHGYRKRVGIAQAIIHRPEVVILDEPISGLDPKQIVEMRSVVRSLGESATVLISSHILSEISQTCDRILVIHRGRLVAEGSAEELGDALGEGARVTLEVRASKDALEDFLKASELVQDFELVSSAGRDRELVAANVTLTGDLREKLVADAVAAGLGVRGIQDAVSELEQIFLELTRAGDRPVELEPPAEPRSGGPTSREEARA